MVLSSFQVVDVLMLVGNVAPIALYFLILGLVNSHSRPYLTTSRSDFVALTGVLIPVLLWPVPILAGTRMWWLLLTGLAAAIGLFLWMLPRAGTGLVIYNISEAACLRILNDALRCMGLSGRWEGRSWRADGGQATIHLRKFALLRNVTLNVEVSSAVRGSFVAHLGQELESRLHRVSQLPSTMGACLVLLGMSLLILPMWMVSRHIEDLVDAMLHLFG